eukprot:5463079-Amphidinium_carterae.1
MEGCQLPKHKEESGEVPTLQQNTNLYAHAGYGLNMEHSAVEGKDKRLYTLCGQCETRPDIGMLDDT